MPPEDASDQRRTSRVWDEIMGDLLRGLEQICGTTKGRDSGRRSSQLDIILSPTISNPATPPPNFAQVGRWPGREIRDNHGNGYSQYRRHSDEPSLRNRSQRAMFVRHIETHEELNSKLFEICRPRSMTEVDRPRTSGELWGAVRLAMNTAMAARSYHHGAEEETDVPRQVRKHQRYVRFQMGDDEGELRLLEDKGQRDVRRHSETLVRHGSLHTKEDQRVMYRHAEEDQSDIRHRAEEDQSDILHHASEDQSIMRFHSEAGRHLRSQEDPTNIRFYHVEEDQRGIRLQPEEDHLGSRPIQVEVGSRNAEDLVVAVDDSRHLTVEAISTFGDNVLYDSPLSDDLTSGSLLCHLTGNGQLHIRRQSPSLASEKFVGTGSVFIPIIRLNETSLELTVVLHIPEDFRFDDVIVRTVDSQLIVIGRKRSMSLQATDGSMELSSQTSHHSVRPSFRVFVQLPKEVNCRSVNASLTDDNQLIVKGEIDPLPRRYSL